MWVIEKLGLVDYQKAFDYQNYLVDLKTNGDNDDYLLLLEHNPVFTMGKGSNLQNILDSHINVLTVNRGGDLTYHCPGQLIGYIIMNLRKSRFDVHSFLRGIEEVLINTLKFISLDAYRISGKTGIWAGGKKIASIGVGVKRGITMHGFALNINPDLSGFSRINPCGLDFSLISSVKELKGEYISVENMENLIINNFYEVFGRG